MLYMRIFLRDPSAALAGMLHLHSTARRRGEDPNAALAGMLHLRSTARRRGKDINKQGATMAEMQMHSTANAPWEDTNKHARGGGGNGKGCYTREGQGEPPTNQGNTRCNI